MKQYMEDGFSQFEIENQKIEINETVNSSFFQYFQNVFLSPSLRISSKFS